VRFALHILFVCTGNICRSPIAERLAKLYATELKLSSFDASSAGTRAVISHPIHEFAAEVIDELGGDSSNFAARQMKPQFASQADLILAMTSVHRDAVLELAPRSLRTTFTLSEAALLASEHGARSLADLAILRPSLDRRKILEVPDPVGRSKDTFVNVGRQISAYLKPVLELCRHSTAADERSPGCEQRR
jgi:protein-tyrosine phosphatase